MNRALLADEELVSLMKVEDREAFTLLYDRYWKDIYLAAYRKLKDKAVAEELAQNLFLSLWVKRNDVEIQNFKAWLFAALRFSIINHFKSQIVHERFTTHSRQSANIMGNETDQIAIQNALSEAIEKGMSMLPEKTQQVFKLSRFENRTIKEISGVLNISEKAVEYHITQSLKSMRLYLKDYLVYAIVACLAHLRF